MLDNGLARSAASPMSLWPLVRLVLGSILVQIIAVVFCQGARLSLFWTFVVVAISGDLWLVLRYELLSGRLGWPNVRSRFSPVESKRLLFAAAGALILIALSTALDWGLTWIGVKLPPIPVAGFMPTQPDQLLVAVTVIGVVGPFAEELVFRGALLDWLRQRYRARFAVVLSSLVFALVHGIAFRSGVSGWLQFGYRFLLGVATCILALRDKSLRSPFVLHAVNNVIACVASVSEGI